MSQSHEEYYSGRWQETGNSCQNCMIASSQCAAGPGHYTQGWPDFYWRCCHCASYFYIGKRYHDDVVFVTDACGECKKRAAVARAEVGLAPSASDAELAQRKAEEKAKRTAAAEAEAERKAEEEAKRRAANEAETKRKAAAARAEVGLAPSASNAELAQAQKRKAEEKAKAAKQKAAAEAKAKAEAEAKRKQEEAAKQKAAAESKAKAEAEAKRQQEEEAKRQQEEDKRKQEAALIHLAEMGFTDRNGNKTLLEQSRNDVATVVDLLSRAASTDKRRENGSLEVEVAEGHA
jgi:hypothetical protein